jgi:hypothetical protein
VPAIAFDVREEAGRVDVMVAQPGLNAPARQDHPPDARDPPSMFCAAPAATRRSMSVGGGRDAAIDAVCEAG